MSQIVIDKFHECYELFLDKAFTGGTANACSIHDVFDGHNCVACNIADSTLLILEYLERFEELDDTQMDFTTYILLLYLLVERIELILDILQIPEKIRDKYFRVNQQIRKWANFIKHPKSFILTHHPTYDFVGSGIDHKRVFSVTINEQFVEQYYKGTKVPDEQKKLNKELYNNLHNKSNILVVFPDIAAVTNKLCFSLNKFIEIIMKNEIYIEILTDEATISNYFENEQ